MRPHVILSLSDGTRAELAPGDTIGRHWRCALPVPDPRVSEAHAMVSLRGSGMHLLGLRGRLVVEGRLATKVELRVGMEVLLAPDVGVRVEEVVLPGEVFVLHHPELGEQALSGVTSVLLSPRLRLAPGHQDGADAWLWSDGGSWFARIGREHHPIEPGDELRVGEEVLRFSTRALAKATQQATMVPGGVWSPLCITARFNSVQLQHQGQPMLHVTGLAARLISELVALGGPVSWEVVAQELWPRTAVDYRMRRRWDTTLSRLRSLLRDHGIREDLILSSGQGRIELVVTAADTVVDET